MIVVADLNRERALKDGIGWPEQYTTIRSGIDVERFRDAVVDRAGMRRSLGIRRRTHSRRGGWSRPDRSSVSRKKARWTTSCKHSGHDRFSNDPDTHFIFVGGGPMQSEFDADVRAAGLSDRVHSLGYRNDVPQLMKLFDIFVLT